MKDLFLYRYRSKLASGTNVKLPLVDVVTGIADKLNARSLQDEALGTQTIIFLERV